MAGGLGAGSDFEAVRERIRAASEIVEVVRQHVELKKAGRSWKGLCPFHKEKTPSFTVNPELQIYRCFGCDAGGDVYRFVQETERVDFLEALKMLAERAGIELPRRQASSPGSDGIHQALDEAAQFYRRALKDPQTGEKARDLLRLRGIKKEVEERFGLGYAPDAWDGLTGRLSSRFGNETLIRAGLGVAREKSGGLYDRFRDRLVVPLRSNSGKVVGFGGRVLGEGEPKYLNSPESPVYRKSQFLFGVQESRESFRTTRSAILVEGYFDVLVLHQAGFENAVAAGGTAITSDQARILARFVDRVFVSLDGDKAGRAATGRSLSPLLNAGLDVRIVMVPEGEDPDSVVSKEGSTAYQTYLDSAGSAVEFLTAASHGSPRAHGESLAAVIELVRSLDELPVREAVIIEADQRLGVGVERLRSAVASSGPGSSNRERKTDRRVTVSGDVDLDLESVPYLERSLFELFCNHPELVIEAFEALREDWLDHPASREAYQILARSPRAGPAQWLTGEKSHGRQLLHGVSNREVEYADPKRALGDHLNRLESRRLQEEKEVIRRRMTEGPPEDMKSNLKDMQTLAARLRMLSGRQEVVLKGDAE